MNKILLKLNRICFWVVVVAAITSMVGAAGLPLVGSGNEVYAEFDKVNPERIYSSAVADIEDVRTNNRSNFNKTYVARAYVLTKTMTSMSDQLALLWTISFTLIGILLQYSYYQMRK